MGLSGHSPLRLRLRLLLLRLRLLLLSHNRLEDRRLLMLVRELMLMLMLMLMMDLLQIVMLLECTRLMRLMTRDSRRRSVLPSRRRRMDIAIERTGVNVQVHRSIMQFRPREHPACRHRRGSCLIRHLALKFVFVELLVTSLVRPLMRRPAWIGVELEAVHRFWWDAHALLMLWRMTVTGAMVGRVGLVLFLEVTLGIRLNVVRWFGWMLDKRRVVKGRALTRVMGLLVMVLRLSHSTVWT